jgi:uncharacterized protein YegL
MRQTGKCLLFFLLLSQNVFAQIPVTPQNKQTPPYILDNNPPLAPSPSLPIPENSHKDEIEIDIDSSALAQSWGNCLQADVWVLVDYSGSMSGFEKFIAEGLVQITGGILGEETHRRMGFISFDDDPTLQLGLTSNLQDAYTSIKAFSKLSTRSGTDIKDGLISVSSNHLIAPKNENAKSSDFKKILILISDGDPENESVDDILKTAYRMKRDGWWIYSIMATKSQSTIPLDQNPYYKLLKDISGNPNDPEEFYVDSILLTDLPDHFKQRFSCM